MGQCDRAVVPLTGGRPEAGINGKDLDRVTGLTEHERSAGIEWIKRVYAPCHGLVLLSGKSGYRFVPAQGNPADRPSPPARPLIPLPAPPPAGSAALGETVLSLVGRAIAAFLQSEDGRGLVKRAVLRALDGQRGPNGYQRDAAPAPDARPLAQRTPGLPPMSMPHR